MSNKELPGMWDESDLTGGETDMPQHKPICTLCGKEGHTANQCPWNDIPSHDPEANVREIPERDHFNNSQVDYSDLPRDC